MSLSAFDQYARPRLAPSNDIEDRFASAVKSALDGSRPPSEAGTVSVPDRRPKRSRVWGIALLCLAFAAIAAAVAAAALHIRRSSVRRFAGETAAMRPEGAASNQPNATVVAPAKATAVAAANATVVATAAPESTAAASNERAIAAAIAPTVNVSSTPASRASTVNELQQPLAPPLAPPRRAQVSRQSHAPAASSRQPSKSEQTKPDQTNRQAAAAAVARRGGAETALPEPSAKVQATPSKRVSDISAIGNAQHQVSASPSPREIANVRSASAPTASSAAARSVLVSSSDRSVYWALEDSGTIFRSTDQKSWQQQESGVQSDLLAGQAVSKTVCWVVGRKGTILLTTDGTRWQRIKSPTTADLVSVSAASAEVADIAAVNGSRFSTFDRGSNWQPNK